MSPEAVEALQKYNIDIGTHVPQQLKPQLVREAQVVLCMTQALEAQVLEQAPDGRGKILTLAEFTTPSDDATPDIPDPIRQGMEAYERTADRLARLMESLPSVLQAWADAKPESARPTQGG